MPPDMFIRPIRKKKLSSEVSLIEDVPMLLA